MLNNDSDSQQNVKGKVSNFPKNQIGHTQNINSIAITFFHGDIIY